MNVDRLIQTYNHILEHPETWHCGTVHCFAGHGQINSGEDINDATCHEDAQEWYGLSDEDAAWLFNTWRTLPEIRSFIYAAKIHAPYHYNGGYNHFGHDPNGYDRFGFDRFGFNCKGFDCKGFDRDWNDILGNRLPPL